MESQELALSEALTIKFVIKNSHLALEMFKWLALPWPHNRLASALKGRFIAGQLENARSGGFPAERPTW